MKVKMPNPVCPTCGMFNCHGVCVKVADPVSHPSHYCSGTIEVIDFIVDQGLDYCLGNVIKYVCRAEHKGTKRQDLEKARQYIDFELEKVK